MAETEECKLKWKNVFLFGMIYNNAPYKWGFGGNFSSLRVISS
jgi:hypothetical protein